jgi:TonB family protein
MTKINKNAIFLFFALIFMYLSCVGTDISKATFPTGETGLNNYLEKEFSWKQGQLTFEGKVYVKFVVDEGGEISDVNVLRGLCEECDLEAIRIVRNMPNWLPATKHNKPIRSEVVIPIRFPL